ncbi:MAG: tryptophan 7-halogenase [Aliiglaciecola sp.]
MVINRVVIVGGGTAGWLTAGTLAAAFKKRHNNPCSVTLIESDRIPIVGVGEGTWPTMRRTLKKMGIRETDFMRECNVAFKQGAKFRQWVTGKKGDAYYHPLMLPNMHDDMDIMQLCALSEKAEDISFSNSVCPQETLCENGLAPKLITTPEYDAVANYAYHLDAGKFSKFLANHCRRNLDVEHIIDDVHAINSAPSGDIASVSTNKHGEVAGDLFVDCTGFSSMLLGNHFGIGFKPCNDMLFADSAIAAQVPYVSEDTPISTHTISTAMSEGWIWDIGLINRRGTGHVYSSQYSNEDKATQQLIEYIESTGGSANGLDIKKLKFESGYREEFWHKNCLAIGLSAGFLEPLEASALLLVEISATSLAEQFPSTRDEMRIAAKRFNKTFTYRWERIIDFLKLHYVLTKRSDTAFWRDNKRQESISDSLKELLQIWRYRAPSEDDFMHATEVFPASSYQFILYGMNYHAMASPYGASEKNKCMVQQLKAQTRHQSRQLLNQLIPHRELLMKIKRYGLQPI